MAGLGIDPSTPFVLRHTLPASETDKYGRMVFKAGELRGWLKGFDGETPITVYAPNTTMQPPEGQVSLIKDKVQIDWSAGTIDIGDDNCPPRALAKRELEVLRLLAVNLDDVVSHKELITEIWRSNVTPKNLASLAVHIKRIRASLNPFNNHLVNVYGHGFGLYQDLDRIPVTTSSSRRQRQA